MTSGASHACRCGIDKAAVQTMAEMDFEKGLWGAASDGIANKVRELINKGISPNISDSYGYTPLHYAARNGHLVIVEELLKNGACPKAQTNGGATPAHRAAYAGHEKIVWTLLTNGAETIVDSDGDTVAHKAAKGKHRSLANDIVKKFPGIAAIQNNRQKTYLDYFDEKL